ncbi:MAG: hypothetical protein J2P22_20190 [Nocardioides sp.]|nr:hypothetical protein [Nocardioides sp.]
MVRVLCAARGLVESATTYQVREMGGVTNVGHHLRTIQAEAAGRVRVLGLYDAPEERFVLRALRREGYDVSDGADLAGLGFVLCDRDLEDELIRALGPSRVEAVLAELGELERFRAFQRQPQWRERDVTDQLHRFAGTASGRKLLLARRLAEELSPDTTPAALAALVTEIEAAVEPR